MIEHRSPISGVDTYSNRYVASAGYDNKVILWDAETKMALACGSHDHLVNHVRFSACGQFLATASSDWTARLWLVPTLQILSLFSGHEDDVEAVSIAPCRTKVATASRDHTVRLWDICGKMLKKLEGHTNDVLAVEWTKEGAELISSSDDGTVRIWCGSTGKLIKVIELDGIQTDTVAVTGNGCIYAGNDTGEIISIDSTSLIRTKAHKAGVKRLAYDSDGKTLLSSSYDRSIKLWSVGEDASLRLLCSTHIPLQVWPRSCAFASRSKIVFGTFGSSYSTFDLTSESWELTKVSETRGLNAVKVTENGIFTIGDSGRLFKDTAVISSVGSLCNFLVDWEGRLITGGQCGVLYVAETALEIYEHSSPLNCGIATTINGESCLLIGTYTGELLIFRQAADCSVQLVSVLNAHDNAIKGISCNGEYIFTVCATGAAAFHRCDDFALVRYVADAHDKISNGCTALPTGGFASVSRDLKLRVWDDLQSTIIQTPHTHSIKCVTASDNYVATGAYDGVIGVYDVSRKDWITTFRPTCHGISCLDYSKMHKQFIASSYDGGTYRVSLE